MLGRTSAEDFRPVVSDSAEDELAGRFAEVGQAAGIAGDQPRGVSVDSFGLQCVLHVVGQHGVGTDLEKDAIAVRRGRLDRLAEKHRFANVASPISCVRRVRNFRAGHRGIKRKLRLGGEKLTQFLPESGNDSVHLRTVKGVGEFESLEFEPAVGQHGFKRGQRLVVAGHSDAARAVLAGNNHPDAVEGRVGQDRLDLGPCGRYRGQAAGAAGWLLVAAAQTDDADGLFQGECTRGPSGGHFTEAMPDDSTRGDALRGQHADQPDLHGENQRLGDVGIFQRRRFTLTEKVGEEGKGGVLLENFLHGVDRVPELATFGIELLSHSDPLPAVPGEDEDRLGSRGQRVGLQHGGRQIAVGVKLQMLDQFGPVLGQTKGALGQEFTALAQMVGNVIDRHLGMGPGKGGHPPGQLAQCLG